MLWLLECAPGLPRDAPISVADLGAGTCAACLGARYALRDYCGATHPFKVWPIDVASSSARFRDAFSAMSKEGGGSRWAGLGGGGYSKEALLPDQQASQYLTEEKDGVDELVTSLLRQLEERGERQPHIVIASFSLHYLKPESRRAAFFALLAETISRPLLLVIVKGVDSLDRHRRRENVPPHVPSAFYAIHYYIGREPKPRAVEAHACLIRPSGTAPSEEEEEEEDRWVLDTFAALERRSRRHGLFTGLTHLSEEKRIAASGG